ncbi:hypothetical protein vseg_007581 [Gypsophila vaccaria]
MSMGVENITLRTNSQLVVSQVNGEYEARNASMIRYMDEVKRAATRRKSFTVVGIPRSQNGKADALARLTSATTDNMPKTVTVEIIKERSTEKKRLVAVMGQGESWIALILRYKEIAELPEDRMIAAKIKRTAHHYVIFDKDLYKDHFLAHC